MKKIFTLFLSLLLCVTIFPRGIVAEDTSNGDLECIDLKDYYDINEFDASDLITYKDYLGSILPLLNQEVCFAYLLYTQTPGSEFATILNTLKEAGYYIDNQVIIYASIVEGMFEFLEHYPIEQLRLRSIVAELYDMLREAEEENHEIEEEQPEPVEEQEGGVEETPTFSPADFIPEYTEDSKMSLFDAFFVERLVEYLIDEIDIVNYLKIVSTYEMEYLKIDDFDSLLFYFVDQVLYYDTVVEPGTQHDIFDISRNHWELFSDIYLPEPLSDYRVGDLMSIYVSLNKVISCIQYREYLIDFSSGKVKEDNILPDQMLFAVKDFVRSDITSPDPENKTICALVDFLRSEYVFDENIAFEFADISVWGELYDVYAGGIWMDDVVRNYFDMYIAIGKNESATIDDNTYYLTPYLYNITCEEFYNIFLTVFKYIEKYSPSYEEIIEILSEITSFDELGEFLGMSMKEIEKRCEANDETFGEWFPEFAMFIMAFIQKYDYNAKEIYNLVGTLSVFERLLSDIQYNEFFTFDFINAILGVLEKGYKPNVKATCISDVVAQDLVDYSQGELNNFLKYSLFESFDEETLTNFYTYLVSPEPDPELKKKLANAIGNDGTYDLINGKVETGDGTIIVDGIHYEVANLEDEKVALVKSITTQPRDPEAINYNTIKSNIANFAIDQQITFDDWEKYALSIVTETDSEISPKIKNFFDLLYHMPLSQSGLETKEYTIYNLFEEILWNTPYYSFFETYYNSSLFFAYGLYLIYSSTNLPFTPFIPYVATETNLTPSEVAATFVLATPSNLEYSNEISYFSEEARRFDISLDKLIKFFDDSLLKLLFYANERVTDTQGKMRARYGEEYAYVPDYQVFAYALTDKDWFIKSLEYVYFNDFRLDLVNLMVYPTLSVASSDVVIPEKIPNTEYKVIGVDYDVGANNSNITSLTLPSTLIAVAPGAFYGLTLNKLDFYSTTQFNQDALDDSEVDCVNINEIQEDQSVITTSLLIPEDVEDIIKIGYVDGNLVFYAPVGSVWELPIKEATTFTIEELLNTSRFEISIPDEVSIDSTAIKEFTIEGSVSFLSKIASDVKLSVVSDNGWKLKQDDKQLAYSIDKYESSTGVVHKFETLGDESITVKASVADSPTYPGLYSDTLTFSYELE